MFDVEIFDLRITGFFWKICCQFSQSHFFFGALLSLCREICDVHVLDCMNDKCIRTLLDEFGVMDRGLDYVNMSGLHLAPLKRLTRLQERNDHISVRPLCSLYLAWTQSISGVNTVHFARDQLDSVKFLCFPFIYQDRVNWLHRLWTLAW